MLPTLIQIGSFKLSTFGVMLALSFVSGSFSVWRSARDRGIDETIVFDHLIVTAVLALFGARLFFVATHWPLFSVQLLRILVIWRYPGLTFLGALIGGCGGFLLYSGRNKLPRLSIFDCYGLAMPLVFFWISLGVLMDGTIIGKVTSLPWGLPAVAALDPRHPVGLYGMILGVIWVLLMYVLARMLHQKQIKQGGLLGWTSLLSLGLIQFLLANTRADLIYLWQGISLEEISSLLLVALGIGFLFKLVNGHVLLRQIVVSVASKKFDK